MSIKRTPKGVVVISATLFVFAVIVAVGCILSFLRSENFTAEVIVGGTLLALVEIAFFGSAGYGLLKGKNWARWATVVVCAIGSLVAFGLLLSGLAAPVEDGNAYMWGQIVGTVFLVTGFTAPCFYLWRSISARHFFTSENTA